MLQHPTNVASMGIQHIQPPGDSDAEDPEEAFPDDEAGQVMKWPPVSPRGRSDCDEIKNHKNL